MSPWEKLAENRIQEAIESGELTLTEAGRPLDLSGYFALPATERVGISLLRSAEVVPPEVELLKQATALEKELTEASPERAREVGRRLQEVRVTFRMAMERRVRARYERQP